MLKLNSQPVQMEDYVSLQMTDGVGNVSVFARGHYAEYYPTEGTKQARRTRAALIAATLGGELKLDHHDRWYARVRY